jgi:hypothetical protein
MKRLIKTKAMAWLGLQPGGRARLWLKCLLFRLRERVKRSPQLKFCIRAVLRFSPALEARLKRVQFHAPIEQDRGLALEQLTPRAQEIYKQLLVVIKDQ